MAKSAPKNEFRVKLNLLHPNEIPPSLPARLLRWVISYGRFIVILTEVVVVAAFVYRFKLDADLDDLKTQIKKDLPYIEGLVADEALIKQTQLKLQNIGQVYSLSPDWKRIFDDISSEIPKSTRINNLTLDNKDNGQFTAIKITGQTNSNNDLSLFIRNLRNKKGSDGNKLFNNINLDSLSFEKEQLIFTISGGAKKI